MVQFLYIAFQDALRRKALRGDVVPRWLAAAVAIPWVCVLSSAVALAGWSLWVVKSEAARQSTHNIVKGFGLSLTREPWPLWAPVPVSCVLLPVLLVLLLSAWARERIQRRVALGGTPFSDSATSESGSESASYTPSTRRGMRPQEYFATAGTAATATWLLHAWLVTVLVCMGVWAAAVVTLHTATKAVMPYRSALKSTTAAVGESGLKNLVLERLNSDVTARSAAVATRGSSSATGLAGLNWGPHGDGDGWGPGGCPVTCVDLSALSYYLGDETCCCDTIGGIFAAEAHSAAASHSLRLALIGLGLLWASLSWLLVAAGCQFAHTESEAMLCWGLSSPCAGALIQPQLQRGELSRQASVQRLSSWLARVMGIVDVSGGDGGRGGGGSGEEVTAAVRDGSREPLLDSNNTP
ncbi:hypothetical protein VaNZ11_012782 [Volvox africanus]|uniref:Uncharacterized protein n=1 Tax=Volvox africanus TaxID=51714 RepID=A0ABQ5SFH5_9CHLO|nr:hypothetical protein VaNZ11_012782 [Volvox africanus]